MIESKDQDNKALNKVVGKSLDQPSFLDVVSPNPGTRYVWPLLLILTSVVMAVMRISLMADSEGIPWIEYKIVVLLLAIVGFGWLLAIKKISKNIIVGWASLAISLILFSFFLTAEADEARFYPLRGSSVILVVFLFAIGMLFLFAKAIHPITILGLLMILFGWAPLFGGFMNAAGVQFPDNLYVRIIILFFGGLILFLFGKMLPPMRLLWNVLVIFAVIIFLCLSIFGVIHFI